MSRTKETDTLSDKMLKDTLKTEEDAVSILEQYRLSVAAQPPLSMEEQENIVRVFFSCVVNLLSRKNDEHTIRAILEAKRSILQNCPQINSADLTSRLNHIFSSHNITLPNY